MGSEDLAVTGTAAWIAAARARESARSDRLFNDPWAHLLAGELGRARLAASERAAGGENAFLPVRTRFFDDVLLEATRWARQVVLLGAGFDTRAYRLALPKATTVYELDHRGTLAAKESVLQAAGAAPVCARLTIGVDLRTDWSAPLLDAGFDPGAPTVWLAEGLMFYLESPTVQALLSQTASLSQTRSTLAFDVFGTGLLRLPAMKSWIEQRQRTSQPLPFCTDEPAALVRRCGWHRCVITEPGQEAACFGRLSSRRDGGVDPTTRTYLLAAERA
ncbi:SAM-dependent methyltransferase [Micromonospora sp. URMC 103]|uniref:SAM-dependent methyltransferase n=1 Tax=Micromonospora sp. URMC 103 TaxID=3423406 RepID=UPI003F1C7B0A